MGVDRRVDVGVHCLRREGCALSGWSYTSLVLSIRVVEQDVHQLPKCRRVMADGQWIALNLSGNNSLLLSRHIDSPTFSMGHRPAFGPRFFNDEAT